MQTRSKVSKGQTMTGCFQSMSRRRLAGMTLALFCLALTGTGATESKVKPLRFVIYGDTRDGHDIHRALVAMILKQKPDFVIQTGDLVDRGSKPDLWKIYDDVTGDMRRKVPVYPARGNHDVGGPGYEERVTAPFTSGTKLHYSFDRSGNHFIALAIDEHTDYSPESEQYKWLIEDLEAARRRRPAHIFVFFHVPPYSIGAHGSDLDVRKTLCPVFDKYLVTAVFNGHDHNYYRTMRSGILYLVTGGGGARLYPVHADQAQPGDAFESVHNIVVCDVVGPKVSITAYRQNGSVIERFTVPAR